MRAFAALFILGTVFLLISYLLSGCTVGPTDKRPQEFGVRTYTETALPEETESAPVGGGVAQSFRPGEDIPSQWWKMFNSIELDWLVRLALLQNRTLSAAQAAMRRARENERSQAGALLYPKLDGNFSAERDEYSGASFGEPGAPIITYNLFNASINVSYLFDIFGGTRRTIEALGAQVDNQRFQLEGAYIALTANVVTTAVKGASLRA
jgi:outer membrane protein TolC